MKTDTRYHMSLASRFRFLVRLLGITAVLAAAAGAFYLSTQISNWSVETLTSAAKGQLGTAAAVGSLVLFFGAAVAIFALLVEIFTSLTSSASGRGAAGLNAVIQIALAVAILGALNVYAFKHEVDFDLTRTKEFTLPPDVVAELQKLKSDTTIVVLEKHRMFGAETTPNKYEYAAERKVVEKVQDAVEMFRKVGPQFNVVVLDVEEQGYDRALENVGKDRKGLADAIKAAPEDSIFFYSDGHIQRMGFNEFYLLDTTESKKGEGNLVLQPQGIEGFVKRIVAIQEKRPKVALLSAHPVLASEAVEGQEPLSQAALKKSLEENGFDVVDFIIKKNVRESDLEGEPAAMDLDENKLEDMEEEFSNKAKSIRADTANLEKLIKVQKRCEAVKNASLERQNGLVREILGARRDLNAEEIREIFEAIDDKVKESRKKLVEDEQERKELEPKLQNLRQQERVIEDRRLIDVKAKLTRRLQDCDLVIIPRMTILNAPNNIVLPAAVHKLKDVHIEVLKEFVKAGKPMLVCSGPTNASQDEKPTTGPFDDLEEMLKERGVEFGDYTILFDTERKAFAAKATGNMFGGSDVPFVSFEPPHALANKKPNPLSEIMLCLQHSMDAKLGIKLRAPRPIYVGTETQRELRYSAEFMWTDPNSWNEAAPLIEMGVVQTSQGPKRMPIYIPQFDPSHDKVQRGPFPIGVAFESYAPESWYKPKVSPPEPDPVGLSDAPAKPVKTETPSEPAGPRRTSRLVVIGQGGAFAGSKLEPGAERLLLNTCNWLLVREDRLVKVSAHPWEYPRLQMSSETKQIWHWGAFIGLPALFVYLGLVVLMIRRIR